MNLPTSPIVYHLQLFQIAIGGLLENETQNCETRPETLKFACITSISQISAVKLTRINPSHKCCFLGNDTPFLRLVYMRGQDGRNEWHRVGWAKCGSAGQNGLTELLVEIPFLVMSKNKFQLSFWQCLHNKLPCRIKDSSYVYLDSF